MLLWKQNTCVNENDGCNNNETSSKALLKLKFYVLSAWKLPTATEDVSENSKDWYLDT